jgi:hypothetical protein
MRSLSRSKVQQAVLQLFLDLFSWLQKPNFVLLTA